MKRIIAMLLSLVLLVSLCACGEKVEEPTVPSEAAAACEEYAREAAAVGKYASGETLYRAVVWSGDSVAAELTKTVGTLETIDLSGAKALVLLYTDKGDRVLVMDAEKKVIHKVASEGVGFSGTAEVAAAPAEYYVSEVELAEMLASYGLEPTATVEDVLRVQALLELEYEAYCAEENTAAVLAQYAEQLTAIRADGTDYTMNEEWLRLQAMEPVLAECAAYERAIAIAEGYAALTDDLAGREEKEEYEFETLILEFFEDEALLEAEAAARVSWAKARMQAENLAADAAKFLEPIAERAAALKEKAGLAYYTNPEYYTLRREALEAAGKNDAYKRYEQAEWTAWLRELDVQFAAERRTVTTDYESAYIEGSWPALIDFNNSYRTAAITLADAEWELKAYETKNEAALTAYNEAAEAIRAKYEDDGYLRDMDYIKLDITNEALLAGLAELTAARDAAADDVAVLMAGYEAKVNSLEEAHAQAVFAEQNAEETELLNGKLLAIAEERRAEASPVSKDEEKTLMLLEQAEDGTVWVESTAAFVEILKGLTDTYSKPTNSGGGGYTGSYSRTCAKSGCTNKAVTSGDSVYCSTHSNRCGECGCYIDGDAMYCMSCISDALTGSSYTGSSNKNNSNKGAGGYDMPNPGESFSDYVQRVDPDLYDSITDRYNSLS